MCVFRLAAIAVTALALVAAVAVVEAVVLGRVLFVVVVNGVVPGVDFMNSLRP
jgi:hypothetical protein